MNWCISFFVRALTQVWSSTRSDQLRHHVSHTSGIYFSFDKASSLFEKDASLPSRKCPGTRPHKQTSLLSNLLHNFPHSRSCLWLSMRQYLDRKSSSPSLTQTISCRTFGVSVIRFVHPECIVFICLISS